jgi:hypothetical protein
MCESCFHEGDSPGSPGGEGPSASRRLFLLAGLGVLAGCAKQTAMTRLPDPPWPEDDVRPPVQREPAAAPAPPPTAIRPPAGVLPRTEWAHGQPVPSRMNRMTPIHHVTVHHDGMDPFRASARGDVAAHLELIRQLHRRKGWGDIGYHFAVDPAGRVWEARPLSWQGAHVKDHNPGNIGIVVLGNFELQSPTSAQREGLRRYLTVLMRTYDVPLGGIHTHQEWEGAATACPGAQLQRYLDTLRRRGGLG